MELSELCEATGFSLEKLRGKSRKRELVWGRYFVFDELMKRGWLYSQIGEMMNRDHSTISHAKKYISSMANDKLFMQKMNQFKRKLKPNMEIHNYSDAEHYLTDQQIYMRKSIVNVNFHDIAKQGFVYNIGKVEAKWICEDTTALEIDVEGKKVTLFQYMNEKEFCDWVKSNFVRVTEMYEAWKG